MYYATGLPQWAREGGGRWWRDSGRAMGAAQNELVYLREYAAGLGEELKDIKARIAEMEAAEKPE